MKSMNSNIKEIDVHQMNRAQAKTYISSQIKAAGRETAILRVVHGYHSGTMLRDMIRKEFRNHPKVTRVELSMNLGITDLILE